MENYWSEILTAIVSISVSYGVIKTKIHDIEEKMERWVYLNELAERIEKERAT